MKKSTKYLMKFPEKNSWWIFWYWSEKYLKQLDIILDEIVVIVRKQADEVGDQKVDEKVDQIISGGESRRNYRWCTHNSRWNRVGKKNEVDEIEDKAVGKLIVDELFEEQVDNVAG